MLGLSVHVGAYDCVCVCVRMCVHWLIGSVLSVPASFTLKLQFDILGNMLNKLVF